MIHGRRKYYRRLFPYVRRQWPYVAAIAGLTVLMSAAAALQPWPLKILVDYALEARAVPGFLSAFISGIGLDLTPVTLIVLAAIASLGLYFLNSALDAGITWAWTAGGQRMVYDFAADVFSRLQQLNTVFHTRRTVGDHLNRLTGDTYSIYTIVESVLISPVRNLFTIAAVGFVAWTLDPVLTLLTLAVTPVLAAVAYGMRKQLKQRSRLKREAQSDLMSFVHQTLNALPVVQAFTMESRNLREFDRLAEQAVSTTQKSMLAQNVFGMAAGLTTVTGTALILYVGGVRVLEGTLTLGTLLVFLAYIRTLQGSFRSVFSVFANLKTAEAGLDRLYEILDSPERVEERPDARPFVLSPGARGVAVELRDLTFGYDPQTPVLRNVSMSAAPGETVAVVGKTGAGKSTLAGLIARFVDPQSGSVRFNGQDIRRLKLADVRDRVALVLQEPFLLPISVKENISFARIDATEAEIRAAARAAQAEEFVTKLPDGYDSVIGERGVTLSGGQRQRLSIARAFLKDAPILILDEPTSALDARTEAQLLDALERLMHGRTTFIIAHRLSTIRNADRIFVMSDGAIIESGSHEALMAARGHYSRLYALQHGERAEEAPV